MDKKNGPGKYEYPSGSIEKCFYINGELVLEKYKKSSSSVSDPKTLLSDVELAGSLRHQKGKKGTGKSKRNLDTDRDNKSIGPMSQDVKTEKILLDKSDSDPF
jgi:hypothetical protein